RQAFLFMLEGKPELALPACDRAEEQVDRVSVSERDRRRLRVWGIRAWAYSKLPDEVDPQHLANARLLHGQALRIYEELHDRYGVAKELLYIGDVVREAIDAHLPADVDVTDTELRRSRLLDILEPIHNLVDEAEKYYRRSIEAFGETQEGIMLSRALRSLGEIMRLQNILHPTKEYYQEAHRLLDSALSNESEVGQGRRIPLTYESLAKLEWDHGALASARGYYEEAFKQLEYVGVSETDNAAEALRNRCLRALDILSKASNQARLTPSIAGALEAVKEDAESAIKWRHACAALVLRVKQAITNRRWEPYAFSDLDPKWIDLMRDMEMPESGGRYILQKHLSAALSKSLTAGFPADKAEVHSDRVKLMQRNIAAANSAGGVGAYHDLCCRGPIERAFRGSYTRKLCENQIDATLALLAASKHGGKRNQGYNLYASIYDVPIGFALRGDRVYLEIPVGLAQSLDLAKADLAPGSVLCYTCDDNTTLLDELTDKFMEFVDLSQNLNHVDSAESWLDQLRKEGIHRAQPAAVGAM
ncbi:MAG: hypothetical protein ACRDHE_18090, partial [Ktedonobacterales bacterium]